MLKIAAAMVGLLLLPTCALAQQRAELNVAWLGYSGDTITQVLSLRNNGLRPIKSARIECNFFRYAKKLGSGSTDIEKIGPDSVGYKTISMASGVSPNRAACRVVFVNWERQSSASDPKLRASGRVTSSDDHPWQLTWQPVDKYH